jgi:hypothetical protein
VLILLYEEGADTSQKGEFENLKASDALGTPVRERYPTQQFYASGGKTSALWRPKTLAKITFAAFCCDVLVTVA